MKTAKLIVAAGVVLVSSAAFAETGVGTYQIDNVTNVYGRTGVPTVQIRGNVQSGAADVAIAGRSAASGQGQALVTTGNFDVNANGRS
jgi:hypothetical protein